MTIKLSVHHGNFSCHRKIRKNSVSKWVRESAIASYSHFGNTFKNFSRVSRFYALRVNKGALSKRFTIKYGIFAP